MAPRSSRLRWASVARVGLVGLVLGGGAAGLVAAARSADRRVDRGRDAARVEEAAAAGQGVATFLDAALAQAGGLAGAVRALPGSAQSVAQSAALSGALAGANLLDGGGFLVDPAGTVVAAPAAQADLYRRQETWPELAQSVTAPTVSGLHADGIEHRVDVLFAAPASAGTVAVGRAPMPAGALAAALGRIREPSATQVVVIDAHNEVVSGPAPSSPGVDAPSGLAPAIQDGRTRPPGLTAARAEGGAPLEAAFAAAGHGWVVLITEPAAHWKSRAGHTTALVLPPLVLAWVAAVVLAGLAEVRHQRQATRLDQATAAFLAVAGHELRTPLTSIRGFSQTLAQRWDDLPADRRHEMVEAIARQSRLLEHLIERLLTAGRLEAGASPPLVLRDVALTGVLRTVVETHQPLAPAHQISVEVAPDVTVRGDPAALGQVFGHLVENAVKYSPAGGVVTLSATARRHHVEVAVQDEGVGLPADFSRLFDRFAQAESVNTRTYDEGGMGLGLFIARTLVHDMGGSIWAEPAQPRGARFVVRLNTP